LGEVTTHPTFSVVIPSSGRPSLGRTLVSVASQVEPGDEIIVIVNDDGDDGNRARQEGAERAVGSHILFCDDDDVFLPGAFAVLRRFASEHPKQVGLFRVAFNPRGRFQWPEPTFKRGCVGGQSMCIPNVPGKLARWGEQAPKDPVRQREIDARGVRPWMDYYFAKETSELLGTQPVWCDVVIGHVRPESNPWRRFRYWLAPRYRFRQLIRGRRAQEWSVPVWRPE
jgi:glycosyltransferase involved in cell wall biosynthesis